MRNPLHFFADMKTTEIKRAVDAGDTKNWIAVLPIAAIEQHGPHLPLLTDTAIGQANIESVLPYLPASLPVTFLPLLPYGKSDEHENFAGTLTLSANTLIAIIKDIGASLAKIGIRKVILANSHGGNVSSMDIAARDLRRAHKMMVVQLSWHRLGYPEGLFSQEEQKHGIHGGQIETAQMLTFRPDLVDMTKAKNFVSANIAMEKTYKQIRATSPIPFGWMSEDLNVEGALGNASLATCEQGEALTKLMGKNFVALLEDLHQLPLEKLGTGSLV